MRLYGLYYFLTIFNSRMQEYFNLDIDNFNLSSPKEIIIKNRESAILESSYKNNNKYEPIVIMTPPLRCSKVKVWPGKNEKYSKCTIDLETTENEWRFTQFLTEIGDRCKYLITENANKWFKYTFSSSSMQNSYSNLFVQQNKYNEEIIQIQLGKKLLDDLDKQTAKSYRNQYIVLRLIFKGILVSNGVFSEIWRADQIYKARQNINSSDSDINDYYEDIGETISIKLNKDRELESDDDRNNTEDNIENTEDNIENTEDNIENTEDKIENTEDNIENIGDNIENIGDSIENIGDKIENIGDKIENIGDKIENIGDKNENIGDKIENIGDKIENTKDKIENTEDKKDIGDKKDFKENIDNNYNSSKKSNSRKQIKKIIISNNRRRKW
jgi:methyl-accepting chemotaxis protein